MLLLALGTASGQTRALPGKPAPAQSAGSAADHSDLPTAPAKSLPPNLQIAFLADLPLSWRSEATNPLERWARLLESRLCRPASEGQIAPSLIAEESWDVLGAHIRQRKVDIMPIQGYEFILKSKELDLLPLIAIKRGGSITTKFLLLAANGGSISKIGDLEQREILVHRDDCGGLVDYWLDNTLATSTGFGARREFARFRSVDSPQNAVLPVFFGEAAACVISERAFAEVASRNSQQISRRLSVRLAESPPLVAHLIAVRSSLDASAAAAARIAAADLLLPAAKGSLLPQAETATLAPVTDKDLESLRTLLSTWHSEHDSSAAAADLSPSPAATSAVAFRPPVP